MHMVISCEVYEKGKYTSLGGGKVVGRTGYIRRAVDIANELTLPVSKGHVRARGSFTRFTEPLTAHM